MKTRFRLAPEEGWLTLGLVLLICLTLAWSVDAVRWVADSARALGARADGIGVAGDSAGANLSAVVTQVVRTSAL